MRARSAIVSLICATTLVLAGCSTGISGVPQLAGAEGAGSGSSAGSPSGSSPSGLPSGMPQPTAGPGDSGTGSGDAGSGDGSSGDAGSADAGSGDGGDSGLPSASSGIPGLPTDLGSLPTDLGDLGSIPGLDPGCLAAAGILISVPFLFLGPSLGSQALTQKDVDQAFSGLGDIPDELKQPVQVLHDAAIQAIGKSGTEASDILSSDKVNAALDTISQYTDAKCGGS
jgi:hypothetical protein